MLILVPSSLSIMISLQSAIDILSDCRTMVVATKHGLDIDLIWSPSVIILVTTWLMVAELERDHRDKNLTGARHREASE